MKSKKTNPVEFFNNNRAMAKAKAMKEMQNFKNSLPKAQYGHDFQGPLREEDAQNLDLMFPSTASVPIPYAPKEPKRIRGFNPIINGQTISDEEREIVKRKQVENRMRNPKYTKYMYKKGGFIKKRKKK